MRFRSRLTIRRRSPRRRTPAGRSHARPFQMIRLPRMNSKQSRKTRAEPDALRLRRMMYPANHHHLRLSRTGLVLSRAVHPLRHHLTNSLIRPAHRKARPVQRLQLRLSRLCCWARRWMNRVGLQSMSVRIDRLSRCRRLYPRLRARSFRTDRQRRCQYLRLSSL